MTLRPWKRIKELKETEQHLIKSLERREKTEVYLTEKIDKVSERLLELEQAKEELLSVTAENEVMKKELAQIRESNSRVQFTIAFDDSLQHIIPIFRHKGEQTFEKLVEIQALDDRSAGNEHAMQLALMSLAKDGIDQILESYYPPVRGDDD